MMRAMVGRNIKCGLCGGYAWLVRSLFGTFVWCKVCDRNVD